MKPLLLSLILISGSAFASTPPLKERLQILTAVATYPELNPDVLADLNVLLSSSRERAIEVESFDCDYQKGVSGFLCELDYTEQPGAHAKNPDDEGAAWKLKIEGYVEKGEFKILGVFRELVAG